MVKVIGVVYLLIPTSNHNALDAHNRGTSVVYLLIPTSNHNISNLSKPLCELYIF